MPDLTPRLGIKKPRGNETVTRASLNENWDIIDQNATPQSEFDDHRSAGVLDHPDGSVTTAKLADGAVTDAKIGSRTVSDTSAPSGDSGTISTLLGWFAYMLRAITGKSNWRTAPATTLEAAKSHMDATTGVHGATSAATPNTIVQRDGSGRIKAAAPSASDDVARKAEVDAHATRTDNPHGTTAEQVGAPRLTKTVPDGTSLNTVTTSGFYRLGIDHQYAPSGVNYGQMIVSRGGDTILQIVTGFNNNEFYIRHGNPPEAGGQGVWQPWRKLWHDGNVPIETGNFTPFIFGSTIAGTIPYSYQTSGRYMKIQNRIFVEGTVRADGPAIEQPTGDLYIGGLPYVIRGEASNLRSPAFTIAALIRLNLPDNGYMIVLEGVQGQSVIRVRAVVDSNEMANVSADDQSFTNAWHIRFSGWYETN